MDIIEQYGGELGVRATGIKEARNEVEDTKNKAAVKAIMRTKYLAAAILLAADEQRHRNILRDLEHDYMKGEKRYQKDVSAESNYLTNYQGDRIIVEFISEDLHFTNVMSKKSRRKTEIDHCGTTVTTLATDVEKLDT